MFEKPKFKIESGEEEIKDAAKKLSGAKQGWPAGTKEIKTADGRREIILSQPTDMGGFASGELVKKAEANQERLLSGFGQESPRSAQFSVDRGRSAKGNKLEGNAKAERTCARPKRVSTRQETLKKGINAERNFRENLKRHEAEDYEGIWKR